MGQLKKLEDLDFEHMTIRVVNETPGSERVIERKDLRKEINKLRGLPEDDRLPWE